MWPCRCGAVLTFPPCAPDLWVLYNLGAIYWRIEGRAGKALDCVRMALHHSPHDKKVGKKRTKLHVCGWYCCRSFLFLAAKRT